MYTRKPKPLNCVNCAESALNLNFCKLQGNLQKLNQIFIVIVLYESRSMVKRRPSRFSPRPSIYFTASPACIAPITPATAPSTPSTGLGRPHSSSRSPVACARRTVEYSQLPGKLPYRGIDPWRTDGGAGVVDEVARDEVVGAVEKQVVAGDKRLGILCSQKSGDGLNLDFTVEFPQPCGGMGCL